MRRFFALLTFFIGFQALGQGSAGIYKMRWFVDKRLTNQFIVNNAGIGNGGINNLAVPGQLLDSVLREVQKIATQELHTDTRFVYTLNRNGKERRTGASQDHLGGLPRATKRQAMKSEYLEYYVKFKIDVGLTKGMGIGNEVASYARLRPYVRIKMKAYGVDRKVAYRKRSRATGFAALNSFQVNMGGVTVTNTNAVPIEKVVEMIFVGLEKFRNKAK